MSSHPLLVYKKIGLLLLGWLVLTTAALVTAPAKTAPAKTAPATTAPVKTAPASFSAAPADVFKNVARVVAVGDIHGDAEALRQILRFMGIINEKDAWIGGSTYLVQTGDIPDRGDHTRAALDLLMKLEKEAPSAGGKVLPLLGNHEVMNMDGDLRYLTPGELASYADQSATPDAPGTPSGSTGHRMAFSADGRYGRWLRTHAAAVQIDGSIFLHGGIAPSVPARTIPALNAWVRQDLFPDHPAGGARLPDGPLWFRGYALDPEPSLDAGLTEVLTRFGAKRMVMGHTTTRGRIEQRFGGRTLFIDTGNGIKYGRKLSALELKGEVLTAHYPTGPEKLIAPTSATPPLR
ncbi:MAG: metallophosphoesterase [Myxococcota bacterium]